MQKGILLLLLLLLPLCSPATARVDFNGDDFWQKLVLDKRLPERKFTTADTVIIIASNRIMQDSSRFMGEARDTVVRYMMVYAENGQWHVAQVGNISQALVYMPDINRDWVIYTEGMGKLFTSEVDRGMRLSATYLVNVLMLDYPSISTTRKSFGNYRFALNNARMAYKDFVPVLDTIKELSTGKRMGTGNLTLFFHSMGNNVMRELVLNGKLPVLNDNTWVDNLILNAACVPQRHHKQWMDKIKFAKHIYVHYNPEDRSLKLAHLVSFKKQLGEKVKRPLSAQAVYINFHKACDNGHSNFLSLPSRPPVLKPAFNHYMTVLHGEAVNIHSPAGYVSSEWKGIGWSLVP